jgi:hypothetical protein
MNTLRTALLSIVVLASFAAPSIASAALTDNLAGYWKLDESSGNASDSSGNATALTNTGTLTYTAAKINNGTNHDTTSKYLSVADPAPLRITSDFSICLWMNRSGTGYFVSKYDAGGANNRNYLFGYGGDSGAEGLFLYVSSNNTDLTVKGSGVTIGTGAFHYVCVVYTAAAGSADFYVDGAQSGTTQTGYPTSVFNSAAPFGIGVFFSSGTPFGFPNAVLDEIGVWSRALSGAEISTLYNGSAGCQHNFAACSISAATPPFLIWFDTDS